MRIGLLSDTHDRLDAVRALMRHMSAQNVSVVLHAGDYCAPFTVRAIAEFQIPLLGVFGSNDGDRESLSAAAQLGIGSELYASPHSFEVGNQQLLVVHDLAEVHERSIAQHQVVVHGGTHTAEMRSRGETLIVNPGEGCGWLFGEPTGAILDLETKSVEFIKLSGPEWKSA